ncbi:hypothetical protein OPQ81_010453 [Rhizoctonia solani]|nr:hypothetical protein OPQ81_010453 [Rhizoctonia solani]
MDFKRIFGNLGRRKRPASQSYERPTRADAPTPGTKTQSSSPIPEAPVAISALVFQPFMQLPAPPPSKHPQPETATTSKENWTNLAAFLDILSHNPVFAPLAAVLDNLSWFIKAHENVVNTKEYEDLRTQLEALFKDLCGHFDGVTSPAMTTSILNLCQAIQTELREVYSTEDRNMISRYLQADHKLDKITGCYRRIQGYLERIMLNATVNIWRTVDKQATESQLRNLNPSMSACYDSAEANVVQRRECTPRTREQVLLDLKAWKDKQDGENVCWINGMAGTGKTTIATTLCSMLNKSHELGASFFCSRSISACRNVNLILPTIAYQLARFSSPFRGELLQVLDRDPDVHTKVPRVQFQRMIIEPLQKVTLSLPSSVVVVIDALDECEGDRAEQILEVLLDHATQLPIKFLVCSRPEYHIRKKIYKSALRAKITLHELDEKVVKEDIETYLQTELAALSIVLKSDDLATLVERAGALFIYAATVVRYIERGHTAERLAAVLKVPGVEKESSNKTKEIDRLYEAVLISAFGNEDLEQAEKERMVLVLHTVVCAQEPLTVAALAGLLSLAPTQVAEALNPFWSVLHISESASGHRVSTLHASFPDYILEPKQSNQFACNAQMHHGRLAGWCFKRIEQNIPQFNVCDLSSSYLFDEDVPDLEEKVQQKIPMDLLYACQYWAVHLSLGVESAKLAAMLHEFLSKRLLLWIEVLNLTKRIDKGILLMEQATSWLRLQATRLFENAILLARDARHFVTMFATSPVSQSTPHLYVSMLASWPDDQPIAQSYTQRTAKLPNIKGKETVERQLALLSMVPAGSMLYSVVYSPNGRFFAASTDIGTILVWDAVSCRMTIDPIEGHTGPVRALSISPDGTQICSGSEDETVRIWDPQNGRQIAGPLTGHTDWVWSVDYSPDGSLIASASFDGTVRIWSTHDWQMKGNPLGLHDGRVFSVAFSPNGSILAAGFKSMIHLWDPFTGRMIGETLLGHTADVNTLAFLPDGIHLISGSDDRTIRIWDVRTGQTPLRFLREHLSGVDSVTVSPDGHLAVSAAQDSTVRMWDTNTWQSRSVIHRTGLVRSVRFSPDGLRLVSGSADGNLRLWEVQDIIYGQGENTKSDGHSDWVRCVALSPCGSYIVSGSDDMTVCIWDAKNGRLLFGPLKGHNHIIVAIGISADSNHIFSASADLMILVWDRKKGELEHAIGPFEAVENSDASYYETWPVAFLFDGRRVVYGSHSGRIYMWEDSKLSFESTGHRSAVHSISFSPDGQSFASGSKAGELIMWDACSGKQLLDPFIGHSHRVTSISFSPDGSQIASGSLDGTIRLWSTTTGLQLCGPLEGDTMSVRSVAFSPDGTYIVSGSQDMGIFIWDIASSRSIAAFNGHTHSVFSVAFSPDGAQIVSGSADTVIRFWNAPPPKSDSGEDYSRESANATEPSHSLSWTMDDDGWVYDNQQCLLLWVPPDLRTALLRPQNTMLISRQGCVELDFSQARIGDAWDSCYQPL